MFLSAGGFPEVATQRNSEKQPYLNIQEFSREYMTKFLQNKRVVCSTDSKALKFYIKKLPVKISLFRGKPLQKFAK